MQGWRVKQSKGARKKPQSPTLLLGGFEALDNPFPPRGLFPGKSKGPSHLGEVPCSHTPGDPGVPGSCSSHTYLLLRKLEFGLSSFLSSCPHCPWQDHMFPTKATVKNDLRFESSAFVSSVLASQIFTHDAHFLRPPTEAYPPPPKPLLFPPEPGLLCSRQHQLLRHQGSDETMKPSQVFSDWQAGKGPGMADESRIWNRQGHCMSISLFAGTFPRSGLTSSHSPDLIPGFSETAYSFRLNLETARPWGFLRTGCPLISAQLFASGNGASGCGDQLNKAQQPPRLCQ